MRRTSFCAVVVLLLFAVSVVRADDPKNTKNSQRYVKATITKVNPQQGTITVRLKDKNGKNVEKTFKLIEDAVYLDSSGNVAEVDVFRSGDHVLYVEKEGKIRAMKKQRSSGIL